ncbi:MAG: pseudouridine synthase [Anaerolineae bacterium]
MDGKNRLSKILASAGVASRRACEELIFSGKVMVNRKIVLVPQTIVSLKEDEIVVDGQRIKAADQKVYYILNKPEGYICSNKRLGSKRIVLDLFAPLRTRLFTVGRLDRGTSGLLIVTNDGHFAHKAIHPSSQIVKEYLVKTEQEISHDHLLSIDQGAFIEDAWVKPVKAAKVRRGTLKIAVMEGKKREVRILVEKAGLTLVSLTRIRIGGLTLGSLPLGKWREMSEAEKLQIFR